MKQPHGLEGRKIAAKHLFLLRIEEDAVATTYSTAGLDRATGSKSCRLENTRAVAGCAGEGRKQAIRPLEHTLRLRTISFIR